MNAKSDKNTLKTFLFYVRCVEPILNHWIKNTKIFNSGTFSNTQVHSDLIQ